MREAKVWIVVLGLVFCSAIFSGAAKATTENNLLSKPVLETKVATLKVAFSVSKEDILKKYENATSLTDDQLVELLKAVGFEKSGLRNACAIAKAESNGRPLAFNGNHKTGDSSYGMFQINMIGELGPDRRDLFKLGSNAELLNPVTNAKAALHMTDGGSDWSSWSSVNGKRYKEWYNKYPCKQ